MSLSCFSDPVESDHVVSIAAQTGVVFENTTVERFGLELLQVASDVAPKSLIVDLAQVARSSTAVINGLLLAKKTLLAAGADLYLCGLRDSLRHHFRILQLEGTVFQIFDDDESARTWIAGLQNLNVEPFSTKPR